MLLRNEAKPEAERLKGGEHGPGVAVDLDLQVRNTLWSFVANRFQTHFCFDFDEFPGNGLDDVGVARAPATADILEDELEDSSFGGAIFALTSDAGEGVDELSA